MSGEHIAIIAQRQRGACCHVQRHSPGGGTRHALLKSSCADRRNLFFSWAHSAQTVRSRPKLTHEGHILRMSTSPRNDSHLDDLSKYAKLTKRHNGAKRTLTLQPKI